MDRLVICKYDKCKKYLLDPILLKCSNNVCKSHIEELIDHNKSEFRCFVCNKQHLIPKDGFDVNQTFNEIILLNLHLSEDARKAADLINKLNKSFCQVEKLTNDPDNFIFDYISETRNKIDLQRERLINQIHLLSNEMLDKLKQLETECKENLATLNNLNENQLNKSDFSCYSHEITRWQELLRKPNIEKVLIDKLIDDAIKLKNQMQEKINRGKNILLMNKECSFKARNKKYDFKLLGDFYVGNFYNFLLLTPKESLDLIKLCEFDPQSQYKLVYQATRDGFSADNFHQKCDDLPNTLTIIKVKGNSNIFGGFCNETWDRSGTKKNDPKAFIFSLINQDNLPLKINVTDSSNAIFCRSSFGPSFGAEHGNDILISNCSNTNQSSLSNLGSSYRNPLYARGSTKAQNYLAGSYYFTTEEIIVYQVL